MKRLIITNGKIILPTSIETDKILICINPKIRKQSQWQSQLQ